MILNYLKAVNEPVVSLPAGPNVLPRIKENDKSRNATFCPLRKHEEFRWEQTDNDIDGTD